MDAADMASADARPAAEPPTPASPRGWLTKTLWAVLYALTIWGAIALYPRLDQDAQEAWWGGPVLPPLVLAFLGGLMFRSRSWPMGTLLGVILADVAFAGYFFTTPESSAADAGQGLGLMSFLSVFHAALAYVVASVGVVYGRMVRANRRVVSGESAKVQTGAPPRPDAAADEGSPDQPLGRSR